MTRCRRGRAWLEVRRAHQAEAVEAAVDEHRRRRRAELLDSFEEQRNRQQRAVESLEDVVDVLRRGQVEQLLLQDDPTSTLTLWVGDQPLQLATTEQGARDAGASAPAEVRAGRRHPVGPAGIGCRPHPRGG